jgi:integrase
VKQAFIEPNDLPYLTFSGCRHANAALALISGINPKAVSEHLGHSSVVITLDT